MLTEFKSVWDAQLGSNKTVQHRIEVGKMDYQTIPSAPHSAGPKTIELEKLEINWVHAMDVTEPAQKELAPTIVFVPKENGTLSFGVDYWKLNAVTIWGSYRVPRMDECFDSLGDATIFSTLDATWGFLQVKTAKEDRDKTDFTSHYSLFHFTRMPFGLKEAPGTFQRGINVQLTNVKVQLVLVYVDDMVIFHGH